MPKPVIDLSKTFQDAKKLAVVLEVGLGEEVIKKIERMHQHQKIEVLSSPNVVFELVSGGQGDKVVKIIEEYFPSWERAPIFAARSASLILSSRYPEKTIRLMNDFEDQEIVAAFDKGGPAIPNLVYGGQGHQALNMLERLYPRDQVKFLSRNGVYTALSWTKDLMARRDQIMEKLQEKGQWTIDGKTPAPTPVFAIT